MTHGLHLSLAQYQQLLYTLGWYGNFIAGYRVYLQVFWEFTRGKYYTEPATADAVIQRLVERGWLQPTQFCPDPERRVAISAIDYNAAHLRKLQNEPVAGHYVDWDYEVQVRCQSKLKEIHETNQTVIRLSNKDLEISDVADLIVGTHVEDVVVGEASITIVFDNELGLRIEGVIKVEE